MVIDAGAKKHALEAETPESKVSKVTAPDAMECEEPASSNLQTKREHDADDELPDTGHRMVQYMEILQTEVNEADELDEQVLLEAGD
jgi:hypothetical protein